MKDLRTNKTELYIIIENSCTDGYEETQINDLMWFEPEYLASLIDLKWDGETGKIVR